MQPIPKPSSAINSWKNAKPSDLSGIFFKQDVPSEDGIQGNTGYPNQFSRILGIDFGIVHEDFMAFLSKKQHNDPKMRKNLFMVLASNNGEFNIYFEAIDPTGDSGKQIQYFESDLTNGGRSYSILPEPERTVNSRYGVSSELRNQFVYNWQVSPESIIGDFFYGRALPVPVTSNVLSGALAGLAFPRFEGLVRVHKYIIADQNLDALTKIVNSKSNISISLGVNSADLLISRDLFTLILEVRDEFLKLEGVTVSRESIGVTRDQELEIKSTINFGDGVTVPLDVTLGRFGVGVDFDNGNFVTSHCSFNRQIEIPFKDPFNGRVILWVTPRYVNLKIENSSGPKIEALNSLISLDTTNVGVTGADKVFGDAQYLEFVQACPPFCGGGDG